MPCTSTSNWRRRTFVPVRDGCSLGNPRKFSQHKAPLVNISALNTPLLRRFLFNASPPSIPQRLQALYLISSSNGPRSGLASHYLPLPAGLYVVVLSVDEPSPRPNQTRPSCSSSRVLPYQIGETLDSTCTHFDAVCLSPRQTIQIWSKSQIKYLKMVICCNSDDVSNSKHPLRDL